MSRHVYCMHIVCVFVLLSALSVCFAEHSAPQIMRHSGAHPPAKRAKAALRSTQHLKALNTDFGNLLLKQQQKHSLKGSSNNAQVSTAGAYLNSLVQKLNEEVEENESFRVRVKSGGGRSAHHRHRHAAAHVQGDMHHGWEQHTSEEWVPHRHSRSNRYHDHADEEEPGAPYHSSGYHHDAYYSSSDEANSYTPAEVDASMQGEEARHNPQPTQASIMGSSSEEAEQEQEEQTHSSSSSSSSTVLCLQEVHRSDCFAAEGEAAAVLGEVTFS